MTLREYCNSQANLLTDVELKNCLDIETKNVYLKKDLVKKFWKKFSVYGAQRKFTNIEIANEIDVTVDSIIEWRM